MDTYKRIRPEGIFKFKRTFRKNCFSEIYFDCKALGEEYIDFKNLLKIN